MKLLIKRYTIAAASLAVACTLAAQDLNTGYFTQDYKYRHQMNAAFGNDQNYIAIPVLGNMNLKTQGNFGVDDFLFKNPANGKYEYTFMHPDVSVEEALSGFNKGDNRLAADIGLTLLSAGFKGFGGYNVIELRERFSANLTLPYELFEFAKDVRNKIYEFNNIGAHALAYTELAFGHSHQINDNLRIGGKLKLLFGQGRTNVEINGMTARFVGDEWVLNSGDAKAEVNINGIEFVDKTEEYEGPGRTGQQDVHVDLGETELDKLKQSGFGLAVDLGAEYNFAFVEGLKVSAALNDLGFIGWKNNWLLKQKTGVFTFKGFQDIKVKDESEYGTDIDDQVDDYKDQISDFVNFKNEGDQGSKTTSLVATVNIGAEYQLPVYKPLSFGLLGQHHFHGDYSWTEGRLSANWAPLKWLDGGVSVAVSSFCTSAGWILNIHPKIINFFIGMDHILGKQTKEFVPLSSNANIAFGMNITWGGKKKKTWPERLKE